MPQTVRKPGHATSGVFELTEDHATALEHRNGRPEKPAEYLDAVREALDTGARKGVAIKGADRKAQESHARKIGNDLRKAAKQLSKELGKNVVVSQNDRYEHPKLGSFKAFEAKIVTEEPSPATAAK